jgi:hypothetical protein
MSLIVLHDVSICRSFAMKPVSLSRFVGPTPRLTLWVPIMVAAALSLFWLGVLALIQL